MKQLMMFILHLFLYVIFYGVLVWPLYFIASIGILYLLSIISIPFYATGNENFIAIYALFFILLVFVCLIISIAYLLLYYLFIKLTHYFYFIPFLIIILITIALKIIVIYLLSSISFFSSHEPINLSLAASYSIIEIIILFITCIGVMINILWHQKQLTFRNFIYILLFGNITM